MQKLISEKRLICPSDHGVKAKICKEDEDVNCMNCAVTIGPYEPIAACKSCKVCF